MTPDQANELHVALVNRYGSATEPADGSDQAAIEAWEADVADFSADVRKLIVDGLSVAIAQDFFKASLRYELSKFPKGEAPDVKHDAGSADDP